MFRNILEVKEANKQLGHFFFSTDTMAFFDSKIESKLISTDAGQFFVTTDQGYEGRRFNVWQVHADGSIEKISESLDTVVAWFE